MDLLGTTTANLSTGKNETTGAGTTTAALAFGGEGPGGKTSTTEEFNAAAPAATRTVGVS